MNQTSETKNRGKYMFWSYYSIDLYVNRRKYRFVFDVASMETGENHYRVGRLKKIDTFRENINNKC